MKLYLSPKYLETAHYYYFSMGVFSSIIAFLLFWMHSKFFFIFFIFYIFHTAVSWYTSHLLYQKMRRYFILTQRKLFRKHIFFIILTSAFTLLLWHLLPHNDAFFLSITSLNYYVFFLAILTYLISKSNIIKKIVEFYSIQTIINAKKELLETLRGIEKVKNHLKSLRQYSCGSNPEIDRLIIKTRYARAQKRVIEFFKKITELIILLQISEYERKISELKKSEGNKELADFYQKEINQRKTYLREMEKEIQEALY